MTVKRLLHADERAGFGATVTFENAAGDTTTLVRGGHVLKAVQQACAIALARDETNRVVCISSPETIYADLQGRERRHGRAANSDALRLSQAGLAALHHPRYSTKDARWTR